MKKFTEHDNQFMQRALELAQNAKGKTLPNPAVGAVLVKKGVIVGQGATQICGGPHAEKVAIANAGSAAKGSTLYVTLEPCCHFGRTPPCTDAIINAGIKKVIASVKDPNPLVAGKGTSVLRRHGIEVALGLCEKEARILNEDFFWHIVQKRPWVSLKLAMTLDGRIADSNCQSQWITNEKARIYVHELRRCHAAIAVGRRTLEKDNPQLTVRHVKGSSPVRIIFSSTDRIPEHSYFAIHAKETRSIVVVPGGSCGIDKRESGIEIWHTGEKLDKENILSFLHMAYGQNISSILIEGGQRLASSFLESGFVNRAYLFYGNKLLGSGQNGFEFSAKLPMQSALTLSSVTYRTFDDNFMITGIL